MSSIQRIFMLLLLAVSVPVPLMLKVVFFDTDFNPYVFVIIIISPGIFFAVVIIYMVLEKSWPYRIGVSLILLMSFLALIIFWEDFNYKAETMYFLNKKEKYETLRAKIESLKDIEYFLIEKRTNIVSYKENTETARNISKDSLEPGYNNLLTLMQDVDVEEIFNNCRLKSVYFVTYRHNCFSRGILYSEITEPIDSDTVSVIGYPKTKNPKKIIDNWYFASAYCLD